MPHRRLACAVIPSAPLWLDDMPGVHVRTQHSRCHAVHRAAWPGPGPPAAASSLAALPRLQVEPEGLVEGYSGVQPGDCVVAFSRRDIYAIKQAIEQETQHRTCVVYGALPPETRRQQAKLFNEPGGRRRARWACR